MPAEQGVGDEGDQDAEDDVELEHARQAPAMLGRRDLGDVERRGHGGDADAQAADEAGDHEGVDVRSRAPDQTAETK